MDILAAEKYLKGFLIAYGAKVPKTHDLDELLKQCAAFSEYVNIISDECSDLTAYGVQPRYPFEISLNEHDMKLAIKHARKVQSVMKELEQRLISGKQDMQTDLPEEKEEYPNRDEMNMS